MRPTRITLLRGMRCFGSTAPKNAGGRALLRPMPYRSLAAPRCEPTPEPMPATRSARFIVTKSQGPAALAATSTNAVSMSLKGSAAGHTSCAAYTSTADRMPTTRQVPTVLDLLRQSRDAVEAYISEHGDRGTAENRADVKRLGIVERPGEELGRAGVVVPDVPSRADDEHQNDGACSRGQQARDARRALDADQVYRCEQGEERDGPHCIRDLWRKVHCRTAAPHDRDEGVEHVVHEHRPTGHVAHERIELLGHVGERGTGAGVRLRHAAVTDRGKSHRNHREQDGGHDVTIRPCAEDAEDRHGRGELDHDHSVE